MNAFFATLMSMASAEYGSTMMIFPSPPNLAAAEVPSLSSIPDFDAMGYCPVTRRFVPGYGAVSPPVPITVSPLHPGWSERAVDIASVRLENAKAEQMRVSAEVSYDDAHRMLVIESSHTEEMIEGIKGAKRIESEITGALVRTMHSFQEQSESESRTRDLRNKLAHERDDARKQKEDAANSVNNQRDAVMQQEAIVTQRKKDLANFHDLLKLRQQVEAGAGKDYEAALQRTRLTRSASARTVAIAQMTKAEAALAKASAHALCAADDCSKTGEALKADMQIHPAEEAREAAKAEQNDAENDERNKNSKHQAAVTETKKAMDKVKEGNEALSSESVELTNRKAKLLKFIDESAEKEAAYTSKYNQWERLDREAQKQAELLNTLKAENEALLDSQEAQTKLVSEISTELQEAVKRNHAARNTFIESARLRKVARQAEWDARSVALALNCGGPILTPQLEDDFDAQLNLRSEQAEQCAGNHIHIEGPGQTELLSENLDQ